MATTTTIFPILNATEEDDRHVISSPKKRQWYSSLPGQLALQGSEFVTMIDHELAPVVAGIIEAVHIRHPGFDKRRLMVTTEGPVPRFEIVRRADGSLDLDTSRERAGTEVCVIFARGKLTVGGEGGRQYWQLPLATLREPGYGAEVEVAAIRKLHAELMGPPSARPVDHAPSALPDSLPPPPITTSQSTTAYDPVSGPDQPSDEVTDNAESSGASTTGSASDSSSGISSDDNAGLTIKLWYVGSNISTEGLARDRIIINACSTRPSELLHNIIMDTYHLYPNIDRDSIVISTYEPKLGRVNDGQNIPATEETPPRHWYVKGGVYASIEGTVKIISEMKWYGKQGHPGVVGEVKLLTMVRDALRWERQNKQAIGTYQSMVATRSHRW